jgi:hypothetical protein
MTEKNSSFPRLSGAWAFYDHHCPVCRATIRNWLTRLMKFSMPQDNASRSTTAWQKPWPAYLPNTDSSPFPTARQTCLLRLPRLTFMQLSKRMKWVLRSQTQKFTN